MKILFVCSKNSGRVVPFITEQAESLVRIGHDVEFFAIEGKGMGGYLRNRRPYLQKVAAFKPDVVHAHFGLSGFLANLQLQVPVVTTFHGCDINKFSLRLISVFPLLFSSHTIFVSQKQSDKVRFLRGKFDILPCGIDLDLFYPMDKAEQRRKLGWDMSKRYILFSSNFSRPEKNAALAFAAMKNLPGYELVELKNFGRDEVRVVMNACDAGLLTSIREGSPMFTKELIACKRPLVSTRVGDVDEQLKDILGCKIVAFDPQAIAQALEEVIQYKQLQYDDSIMSRFDNQIVAKRLVSIYQDITK